MRIDFGSKTWLFPMPVLIVAAYDENGNPNAMNAAWGGIHTDNMIGICLSNDHKTTSNILKSGAFTVSMATADTIAQCDYVGIVSANNIPDKFSRAGFTAIKSPHVNAPIIKELHMTLECQLDAYDEETCYMTGKIINVSADESIIGPNGKISPSKLRPVIYDPVNHDYLFIGEKAGDAFSCGKSLINKD